MGSTKSVHPILPSLLPTLFGLMSFIRMLSNPLLLKFCLKNCQISVNNSLTKFQISPLQCLRKCKLIIVCLRGTCLSFCSPFRKFSRKNLNSNNKKRNTFKRVLRKCQRPNPWLIFFPKTLSRSKKNWP
jgi:hypothetical protein